MIQLEKLRCEWGWSKSELARRARMASGDIGKIESGRLVPYSSQLTKLARALKASDPRSLMSEVECVGK